MDPRDLSQCNFFRFASTYLEGHSDQPITPNLHVRCHDLQFSFLERISYAQNILLVHKLDLGFCV